MSSDVPPGFEPIFRSSPFLDTIGPLYNKGSGAQLAIGLRVHEKHLNGRRLLHGGVLATLADVALGLTMATSTTPPTSMITTSLTVDFAGSASLDDWIETSVDIHKVGARLAFANAWIHCKGERIARGSGLFLVVQK